MISIELNAETCNTWEAASLLRHIASQIDKGFTSGLEIGATWNLTGEPEEDDSDGEESLVPAG